MDNRRLHLFIVISIAIWAVFYYLAPPPPHPVMPPAVQHEISKAAASAAASGIAAPGTPTTGTASASVATNVPRIIIDAPRVRGSLSLVGARLDDLRLNDYHETVDKISPLVRILAPSDQTDPAYVEFGWSGPDSVRVPDTSTVWQADHDRLTKDQPVTLSWDNTQGLTYKILLSIDANYVFSVRQEVQNTSGKDVALFPWARIRRDFAPTASGYNVFEGMLGVSDNRLHNMNYKDASKAASATNNGLAYETTSEGGWAGFTDKYWLTILIPDQLQPTKTNWFHITDNGADSYQVGYIATSAQKIAPGATAGSTMRLFAGAKEVHLLDRYENSANPTLISRAFASILHSFGLGEDAKSNNTDIPMLSYAVDWGWFFIITKPFFYALDYLNMLTGNFGIAILIFTVMVKAAFFPLASTSYRSMAKMRVLAPKVQEAKDKFKDDPAAQQKAMMDIYKAEKVNPASGCLPMLIQIPVFFSLYKVILITIEMRHAPFFLWVRDLSAVDPTNIFNLFGLIPFDPGVYSHFLHLGILPVIMGFTMWFQQKLNPPPPDPAQAQMFQFMPIIFTFMMGSFPAGLVIYWTWNNTLTICQQLLIQRQTQAGFALAKR